MRCRTSGIGTGWDLSRIRVSRGVRPAYRGSWNVPRTGITDFALLRSVLKVIFRKRRETELGMEASSVWWPLYGGLALYCKSENVVIEPGCCANLSDAARWHEVVDYKEAAWWPLPIGHATQWVQYRAGALPFNYEGEALLVG